MDYKGKIAAFLVGLVFILSVPGVARAADYYMSPTGNDSNDGRSVDRPWQTMDRLQEAQASLRPGDTIWFRGGDYLSSNIRASYYSWRADGTASAPITYKNYDGETPVIVYNPPPNPGTSRRTMLFLSGDYLVVDGINFRLTEEVRRRTYIDGTGVGENGRQSVESVGGIGFYGRGSVLRRCHIDNFAQTAVYNGGSNNTVEFCRMTNNVSYGLYISSSNSVYRYNVFDGSRGYTNGHRGIQLQYYRSQGNKVYGNLIINSQVSGVTFSGRLSNNEVYNNVIINPGLQSSRGQAVDAFCEDGIPGPGNKFYNNTVIGKIGYAIFIPSRCVNGLTKCAFHNTTASKPHTAAECAYELAQNRPNLAHIEIRDNIFYPSNPVRVGASLSNIHSNIFYNITGAVPPGNTLVDPKLVNPNGTTPGDAALQPGSPALDAGRNSAFPSDDFESKPRPAAAAYDIGAFEGGYEGRIPMPPSTGVPPATPRPPSTYNPEGRLCPI